MTMRLIQIGTQYKYSEPCPLRFCLILFVGQAMAHPLEGGDKAWSFLGCARGVELGKQST